MKQEADDNCAVSDYDPTADESTFFKEGEGIKIVAEKVFRDVEGPFLRPEATRLFKWIKQNQPEVAVEIEDAKSMDLRSVDFWLPLIFLAQNVSLPFYINLVSNYVYDMARGNLKSEEPTVHLAIAKEDTKTGVIKRFDYNGPANGLKDAIKKIDVNSLMED